MSHARFQPITLFVFLTVFAAFFALAQPARADFGTTPPPTQLAELSCSVIVTNRQSTVTNNSSTTQAEFWVTYIVRNDGPGVASNFTLRRGVNMTSGNISLLPQTVTLAAGEAKLFAPVRLEAHPSIAYADLVQVWGLVDAGNVVVESNELNNLCSLTFMVELVH